MKNEIGCEHHLKWICRIVVNYKKYLYTFIYKYLHKQKQDVLCIQVLRYLTSKCSDVLDEMSMLLIEKKWIKKSFIAYFVCVWVFFMCENRVNDESKVGHKNIENSTHKFARNSVWFLKQISLILISLFFFFILFQILESETLLLIQ